MVADCIDCGQPEANPPARVCDDCQAVRLARAIEDYTGTSVKVPVKKARKK